ncbi:MAG: peptide chain release factor N(5)-glutamine methyltransferase [Hyphomicrobiaceae bacterium]
MQSTLPNRRSASAGSSPGTLGDAVRMLRTSFRNAGLDSPGLDARRLVLGTLSLDDDVLLREPDRHIDDHEQHRILAAQTRRLDREPVSRILGKRSFHGLEFEIAPATLDPRPDTETLVDGVLRLVTEGRVPGGETPRILDIGTGSGAILVALLHRLPKATGLGTDVSEAALEFAGRNAARHGLETRVAFEKRSWLDGVSGRFDIVVSNPPYILTRDLAGLEPEVARFDPPTALDGGLDGLDAYRAIARDLRRVLVPGGWVAVEVGMGQSDDVAAIIANGLYDAPGQNSAAGSVWFDLGGVARCVAREARR